MQKYQSMKKCSKDEKSFKKGIFITFEGIEGSGKTTQVNLLKDFLKQNKIKSLFIREQGSTILSEKIREILLNTEIPIEPLSELFLFLSSRAQITKELIIPALKRGEIVVSDRFLDATVAYQGYGRGFDIKFIGSLNAAAAFGLKPDLTFLLDLPTQNGFKRLDKKLDRLERESKVFHQKVREGYLKVADENKERIVVINALKGTSEIHKKIKSVVMLKFGKLFEEKKISE